MPSQQDEIRVSCPKCGASLYDDDTYCIACGLALEAQRCERCDAPARKDARFCFKCGAALPVAAVPGAAPPTRSAEEKPALVTPPPVRARHDTPSPKVEPVLAKPLPAEAVVSIMEPAIRSEPARNESPISPPIAVTRRNRDARSERKTVELPREISEAPVPPRIPETPVPETPVPPQIPEAPRPPPTSRANAYRNIWPVAVVAAVSLLAAGTFWMFTGPDADTKKTAEPAKTTAKRAGAKPALAPRPKDDVAAAQGFSVKHGLEKLYGGYDPNLDGAFWTVSGAPKNFAPWNGKKLLIRPLVSKTFSEGDNLRHVLVTNSLDTKDGMVVKQGTGCPDCRSLIGAAIFEKQGDAWKLISRHDFLTADGAFGAPPKVTVDFPSDGGIQLVFERADLLDRDPQDRSYSIVLRERKAVKSAMR